MRYLISVTYDGSKLYGFQRLNKHKTVQGELERVLTKINKTMVVVKGAGRTDRGVHANGQRAHFDVEERVNTHDLNRFIKMFRLFSDDDIVIYTGYTEKEILTKCQGSAILRERNIIY